MTALEKTPDAHPASVRTLLKDRFFLKQRLDGVKCVYAVGDVHGQIDLLDATLEMIRKDIATLAADMPKTLIFLGDLIDRGNSRAVLQRLSGPWGIPGIGKRIIAGNHEGLFARFLAGPGPDFSQAPFGRTIAEEEYQADRLAYPEKLDRDMLLWISTDGGADTLRNYGCSTWDPRLLPQEVARLRKIVLGNIPREHIGLLKRMEKMAAPGDFVFVHAGIDPARPLDQQTWQDCGWIRKGFLNHKGGFEGRIVVHGHTPCKDPDIENDRLCLDTGAFLAGTLTWARFLDTKEYGTEVTVSQVRRTAETPGP
ncbi:MAG: metallophosphoesterase [Pseudomonadota bacterium]|nr:metallophosphoesterase [Pseudomonadota bacterium]